MLEHCKNTVQPGLPTNENNYQAVLETQVLKSVVPMVGSYFLFFSSALKCKMARARTRADDEKDQPMFSQCQCIMIATKTWIRLYFT